MKECSRCHKVKTIEEFVKDKNKKDGTRSYCKECYNLTKRKTPIKPIPRDGYKFCAMCYKELPLTAFNVRKRKPFSYCKECERKRDSNRYHHICAECGKEYRSGRKDSNVCGDCRNRRFAETGKRILSKRNAEQFGENNVMFGVQRFGRENPNYKPDKTDEEREKGRLIVGYADWRQAVYEKDNYTCQCCGYDKGGTLNAHHLDGYEWCKEKRTQVENGVTLCEECHKKFHVLYGWNGNTKEQFYEFRDNKKYIDNMLIPR